MKFYHLITFFGLTIFISLFTSQTAIAQDTTQVVVYDVVYLKDGRVLKGDILSYDAQFGGISFRDPYGRVYNFGREEYKYFEENQSFPVKKKNKEIRPRKDKGFGFNVGVSSSYLSFNRSLTADDYYISNSSGLGYMPLSLYVSAGKHLGRQHYVGLTADLGMVAEFPGYYTAGVRYTYQYDAHKTNRAFYIPVELEYQHAKSVGQYNVNDTLWYDQNSWSYPAYVDLETSFSNLAFTIGHGFGFILKGGHAFNIELSYMKSFVLSTTYGNLNGKSAPNVTYSIGALRLGMFYSF